MVRLVGHDYELARRASVQNAIAAAMLQHKGGMGVGFEGRKGRAASSNSDRGAESQHVTPPLPPTPGLFSAQKPKAGADRSLNFLA